MKDVTLAWRTAVKAARAAQGLGTPESELLPRSSKGKSGKQDGFAKAAGNILQSIQGTQGELVERARFYLAHPAATGAAASSAAAIAARDESERDRSDTMTGAAIKGIAEGLEALKAHIGSSTHLGQPASDTLKAHRAGQVQHLYAMLEDATGIWAKQKTTRAAAAASQAASLARLDLSGLNGDSGLELKLSTGTELGMDEVALEEAQAQGEGHGEGDGTEGLSEAERALIMDVSESLANELSTLADQVREVEASVAQVVDLQAVFASKVTEQSVEIEQIYQNISDARVHVDKGNDQLRQATERKVTFRLMMMMIMLMLAFSLLFLDWYVG